MRPARLIWKDGRFTWLFVLAVVLGTIALLAFDWYWRTHETAWSRWF